MRQATRFGNALNVFGGYQAAAAGHVLNDEVGIARHVE
jgi:hypothetical protein